MVGHLQPSPIFPKRQRIPKQDPKYIREIENLKIKLNEDKLKDIMNLDYYEETPSFQAHMKQLLKWLYTELQKSFKKFQKAVVLQPRLFSYKLSKHLSYELKQGRH